jgi:hypothetical protein
MNATTTAVTQAKHHSRSDFWPVTRVLLRREVRFLQENWNIDLFLCLLYLVLRHVTTFTPISLWINNEPLVTFAGWCALPTITYFFISRSFRKDRATPNADEVMLAPGASAAVLASKYLPAVGAAFVAHLVVSMMSLALTVIAPVFDLPVLAAPLISATDLVLLSFFHHAGFILAGTLFLALAALFVQVRFARRLARVGAFALLFAGVGIVYFFCSTPMIMLRKSLMLTLDVSRDQGLPYYFLPLEALVHGATTLLVLAIPMYLLYRATLANLWRVLQRR